jgi:hypothetical protein
MVRCVLRKYQITAVMSQSRVQGDWNEGKNKEVPMWTRRVVMVLIGITVWTGFVFSQGAMVHAEDQLVGVTRATNLIGKQVKNVEEKNLGEIQGHL